MAYNGRDFWDALIAMTPAAQQFHSATVITSPYEGDPLDLTIFIYSRDRQANIIATLDKLIDAMHAVERSYEIIIIDDASTDGSVEIIRQYITDYAEVNILLRANRKAKGLAQNYIDAAFMGRGKYFRLVYADNAEPMETLAELFKTLGDADIIVPYYISSNGNLPEELIFTKCYRHLLNAVTGQRINNYSGEPVHLRFNVMRWHPDSYGAGFNAGLLCRLLVVGFTYKQLPCRTHLKRYGTPEEIGWLDAFSMSYIVVSILTSRIGARIWRR